MNKVELERLYAEWIEHYQTKYCKGGFTQNPVAAYDPAYGERQSSHMQQEHHQRHHRQSGLLTKNF